MDFFVLSFLWPYMVVQRVYSWLSSIQGRMQWRKVEVGKGSNHLGLQHVKNELSPLRYLSSPVLWIQDISILLSTHLVIECFLFTMCQLLLWEWPIQQWVQKLFLWRLPKNGILMFSHVFLLAILVYNNAIQFHVLTILL